MAANGTTFGLSISPIVVIWIAIKAVDDFSQFVTVTLNGLSLSALYFVVASGFTLIFGLMRVVNMAHGSLYLLGGYLALNFQEKLFQKESGGLNLSRGRRSLPRAWRRAGAAPPRRRAAAAGRRR